MELDRSGEQQRTPDKSLSDIYDVIKPDLDRIDKILSKIAERRGSTVFALLYTSLASIHPSDLHKIYTKFKSIVETSDKENIDIVLHTMGGDANAAFQLGFTIQRYVEELESKKNKKIKLNIIVPRSVKSAGTLLALCGNHIILTRVSELGPIDPQIYIERRYVSAKTIRDSLKQVMEIVSESRTSTSIGVAKKEIERAEVIKYILSRIPVAEMGHYESLLNHVTRLAQELLKNRMMKEAKENPEEAEEAAKQIAEQLVRGYEYHGFPITYWHLKNMGISCSIVDTDELEKSLLELYDIIRELDRRFFFIYALQGLGKGVSEVLELIGELFQEVIELNNGIIVILLPSLRSIEKLIEEFSSKIYTQQHMFI